MNFIDTHAHLYDEQFEQDSDAMIQRALDAGVKRMYMPNCDQTTISPMLALAERWAESCLPMMGLHPVYVNAAFEKEMNIVEDWLCKRKFYAIGEIGLDKYWDVQFLAQQKIAFEKQIDLALAHDLPIVVHSREATPDCIQIIRAKQNGSLQGIFHCFSGTIDEAQQLIDLGMKLGIGGVATFKKSTLPEVIRTIGIQHLVLETDAPYLAPVPFRGKRNESSYIPTIAATVATILNKTIEEVAEITTQNGEKIFGKSFK
ncbi:MAG: TatD family hydrolase [Bacteroidetes bacterium]|nr:TatD family hydrolase [Bacteroidota bacterium]